MSDVNSEVSALGVQDLYYGLDTNKDILSPELSLPQDRDIMTATSTAASSLPPVRTSCHVPLSLMTSISEETIALWLKLGALEKLEQAVLDGYGDQLCGKTSRIPQVNKFLKQVPLFQNKIREIHQAVSQGRLRDVQHLIDRKKLAFCRDHNGASPLHKAVIFGHQDVIEYLVKRYAGSIHIRDHQGRTALHYAAFLPDQGEIYQYLLANGADERAMDVYGRQPSYYLDGQNESTLRQLRDGSTLNGLRKIKPRYYGQVSAGQPYTNSNRPTVTKSQIREIIAEGNIDALEDLVLQGQGDRLLGETSSNPKIQSFLNIVPMYMERIYDVHRAVMRDQLEHVVILLENKKLAMARDQLGATPLHKAVLFGHYKIAHYIGHQFPDLINAIDMEGRTALHYAAALKDSKNMYGILIDAGANKGINDNKGKTADYYVQYPEHLNLEEIIKRSHKVNANYLANTSSRIKGKSPVRQTPPPSNGNISSPRSEENNSSSKDTSQSYDSGNENELMTFLQKDKLPKRLDMSSANIRRWVNTKDIDKLTKAVMEGYGEKVVRVNTNEECDDKEQITGKITEMVDRINAIHSAVSSDDLTELQNHLEERDFALAKDHMGNTPLHKSVLLRKTKIVGFLIEKFPETINAKNKNGLTALHYAAAMSRKDGLQLYKMLLQSGADPKIRDNHGRTPDYYKTHLITLPKQGVMRSRPMGSRHTETLNRYSKQGVLERMTTALQRGDVELLQDLVLEGHGKHLFGKTSWNEDVKSFLKELPSYLDKIELLHEATRAGNVETVKELVTSNDKLIRARDESGALPIHIAAASESLDAIQHLVKNHPSVINMKDTTGKTALHIASQKGNIALCKLLKQAGADPKILDQKGKTADFYLQAVKHNGHKMDFESTKSTFNSSSEGSQSTANTERPRRKSRDIKKQKLKQQIDEKVEKSVKNDSSSTNEVSNISTETEKPSDSDISEESRRKESSTESQLKDVTETETEESGDVTEIENVPNEKSIEENNEDQEENTVEENKTEDSITGEQTDTNVDNVDDQDADKGQPESENMHNNEEDTVDETNVQELENISTNVAESDEFKLVNEENTPNDPNENANSSDIIFNEVKNEEKLEEADEDKTDKNAEKENTDNDYQNVNYEEENEKIEEAKLDTENNDESTDFAGGDEEVKINEAQADEVDDNKTLTKADENDGKQDVLDFKVENEDNEGNSKLTENGTEREVSENVQEETRNLDIDIEGVPVAEAGSRKKDSVDYSLTNKQNENENEDENPEEHENIPSADANAYDATHNEIENQKINEAEEKETEEALSEDKKYDDGNVEGDEKISTIAEYSEEKMNECVDGENKNNTNQNENETFDENVKNDTEKNDETLEQENEAVRETEDDANKEESENNEANFTNDSKLRSQDKPTHQTKDHLDELIEHWIKEGDLLRLEHVVLAGQGDRLIERTSSDKQVQDFLDLVPIYMAKIRAVHEAVAKGQLREVRSVLTRKRFALSRDHVGASPLHLAVLYGHTDVSTYIISHFPETMDGPDNEGRTPLHYAAALRDSGSLYKLLKMAGADENIEDKAGHSPKYYMCNEGQLMLETLLEPYSSAD